MVQLAIDTFGGLDVIVNNAGIVRDRMFVNSEESEWEAVLRVHVLGHAAPARHAASYWRVRSKAGEAVDARVWPLLEEALRRDPRPARPSMPASSTRRRVPG